MPKVLECAAKLQAASDASVCAAKLQAASDASVCAAKLQAASDASVRWAFGFERQVLHRVVNTDNCWLTPGCIVVKQRLLS